MSDPEERDGPDLCAWCGERVATREVEGDPACDSCPLCDNCGEPAVECVDDENDRWWFCR